MGKSPEEIAAEARKLEAKELIKDAIRELREEEKRNPSDGQPKDGQNSPQTQKSGVKSFFDEFFGLSG